METTLTEEFFDQVGETHGNLNVNMAGLHDFIRKALGQLPSIARVLDVGCGTGKPVSSTLAASGHRVFGIDISQVMIDLSRRQVPSGSFEKADMLEYIPNAKFDVIFAIFSFFSFSRQQLCEMLSNFSEWLLPNGLLFLGTIAADDYPTNPSNYDSDGLCASGLDNKFMGHTFKISLFTKQGWSMALERAGFEIMDTETTLYKAPPDAQCEEQEYLYFIQARKVSGDLVQ
ncbi:hypothetical protein MMC12_002212 [Toensbergia leucococca]|nr:hypothetical protein [Toensbergia leucococca]